MSLTAPALRRPSSEPAIRLPETGWAQLQTLCALLALAGLGFALMHSGGRDRGTTEVALALAAPSLLLGRVWRNVPLVELVVSAAVVMAATLLPFVTPLGISAARDLNAYTYAVVLYLVTRSFAQNAERRRLVAVVLLALAVIESTDVWRVWVGEHSPGFQVVGTFYWHNQFGIFAAAITLVAAGLAMRGSRLEDAVAWLVAPLFAALAVMSQSRGAMLSLAVAGVTLVSVTVGRRQWKPLIRLGVIAGLSIAVFAGFHAEATGGGGGRAGGVSNAADLPAKDTLSSTSNWRLSAGEEAMKVFTKAPLVSHGYGSLRVVGWRDAPAGTTTSPYAHSTEAQALSDGGLFLGLPVLAALALLAWGALRSVFLAARREEGPGWLQLGAGLAAIAMLIHTSMDFDSIYPVLLALPGLLVALAAPAPTVADRPKHLVVRGTAVALAVLACVLGALLVASYWQTTQRLNLAASQLSANPNRSVAAASKAFDDHRFPDPRPATFIVQATDVGLVFDQATLRRALRDSLSYAQLDPSFRPVWERVNAEVLAEWQPTAATTTSR